MERDLCSGCCLGFVVVVMGSHPVRFIDPTEMRKAFVIETLAKATRFESADQARIRATSEMTRSQFTVTTLLKCPACDQIFAGNDAKAVAFHMEHSRPAAAAAPAPAAEPIAKPVAAPKAKAKKARALPLVFRPEGVRYSVARRGKR